MPIGSVIDVVGGGGGGGPLVIADLDPLFNAVGQVITSSGDAAAEVISPGAFGTVLTVDSAGGLEFENAGPLAIVQYAPSAGASYPLNAGSLAALDTTNLTISTYVPGSLALLIKVRIFFFNNNSGDAADFCFALFLHDTTTIAGLVETAYSQEATLTVPPNQAWTLQMSWYLSPTVLGDLGFASGDAIQLDLAGAQTSNGNGFVYALGKSTFINTPGDNQAACLLEVWPAT